MMGEVGWGEMYDWKTWPRNPEWQTERKANLIYPQLLDRTVPKLLTGKLKLANCTLVQTLVYFLWNPITGKIRGSKAKVCLVLILGKTDQETQIFRLKGRPIQSNPSCKIELCPSFWQVRIGPLYPGTNFSPLSLKLDHREDMER